MRKQLKAHRHRHVCYLQVPTVTSFYSCNFTRTCPEHQLLPLICPGDDANATQRLPHRSSVYLHSLRPSSYFSSSLLLRYPSSLHPSPRGSIFTRRHHHHSSFTLFIRICLHCSHFSRLPPPTLRQRSWRRSSSPVWRRALCSRPPSLHPDTKSIILEPQRPTG